MSEWTLYIRCPENITSPIADEVGMVPNEPCPGLFHVNPRSALRSLPPDAPIGVRCPYGHQFCATPADIHDLGPG